MRSLTLSQLKNRVAFKPLPGSENVKTGRPNSTDEKKFFLNDLNLASVYFTFFQILLSLIIGLLMVREVIRILISVRDLKIFIST
jgi:hypothetical protein